MDSCILDRVKQGYCSTPGFKIQQGTDIRLVIT